jgi:hypothetical protein
LHRAESDEVETDFNVQAKFQAESAVKEGAEFDGPILPRNDQSQLMSRASWAEKTVKSFFLGPFQQEQALLGRPRPIFGGI